MKTVKFIKTEGRWFPCIGTNIDMRGSGFKSKREVLAWVADRLEFAGESLKAEFI